MKHNQDLTVSSPLSSIPNDLNRPSSSINPVSNSWPTGDSAVSVGRSPREASTISEHEQCDDHVVTDYLDAANESSLNTAPSLQVQRLRSPEGFADSDMDAAIAASLVDDRASDSLKRPHNVEDSPEGSRLPAKNSTKVLSGAAKAAATRRKTMLFTSEKSPLTRINLSQLLRLPEAWRVLTYEQQKELASGLPHKPSIGGAGAHDSQNVMLEALMSNDALRTDVREWHEGLQAGMEDPDWREEAADAMEKRARGDFGTGKWTDPVDTEQEDGDDPKDNAPVQWWKDPTLQ